MGNFRLTQSSLKDLENPRTCPSRWEAQWIRGEIPFSSNANMDRGNYFEYHCLGSMAKNEPVPEIPLLSSGKKSADHERIDAQIEMFKRLFDPGDEKFIGHIKKNVQISLPSKSNREGTIDFDSIDMEGNIWIVDLKLTKDLESSYSEYGWGNDPRDMDLIQLVHYSDLYEYKFKIRPKVGILIFDYSPKMNIKFTELVISDEKREEKDFRFEQAREVISMYEKKGWSRYPSIDECKNCPLDCNKRAKPQQVIIQKVNY